MDKVYLKIKDSVKFKFLTPSVIFSLLNALSCNSESRKYKEINEIVSRAVTRNKLSMVDCHALVNNDCLYDYLMVNGIEVGYFAYALTHYVFTTGQFKFSVYDIYEDIFSLDQQEIYNMCVKKIIDTLGVFYD